MQWLGHEARRGYMLKRPPHKLWLKRATIDYKSFFKGGRSLFLDGDDGPFHLLATAFRTRVREKLGILRLELSFCS
uniref:Uncharacterized protein n=1 Tax=Vespula pensylvanica TaxID=30213 RepID=A0A834JT07_VESPE|nr:hypothetical protein H0235_016898 [Vespula pensylvanica]